MHEIGKIRQAELGRIQSYTTYKVKLIWLLARLKIPLHTLEIS